MTRTLETMQRDLEKAEGVLADRRAAMIFASNAHRRAVDAFRETKCEVYDLGKQIEDCLRNLDQSQSQHTLPIF
jgi:hypothetical protein